MVILNILSQFKEHLPMNDELVITGVMGTDMSLSHFPKPATCGIPFRGVHFLPLRLVGWGWPGELDGDRPQCAIAGEEEEGSRSIQCGVFDLSHLVYIWQVQIMVVQHKQLLLFQGLHQQNLLRLFSKWYMTLKMGGFVVSQKKVGFVLLFVFWGF